MTGRGLLLAELEKVTENCCRLFSLVQEEHLSWRPQDNMRSLSELANHLAQIPAVDLHIMQGVPEPKLIELEENLQRASQEQWSSVMRQGCEELTGFMAKLSFDEFENNSGTAYYGRTQTFVQWLLEVVTHIFHHRSQLFMYLKLNGYDVDTRTLYS